MDWVMKNKKTGEIVSILSQSWGTDGSKVYYAGRDAVCHEMMEKDFLKKFEQIEVNLEYLVPYILEASKADCQMRKIIHALARKCTPGYYNVGDTVHVINIDEGIEGCFDGYLTMRDMRTGYYYYDHGRDRLSFKITAINNLNNVEAGLFEFELSSTRNDEEEEKDVLDSSIIKAPKYLTKVYFFKTRLFAKDASYYLKRYDREI